MGGTDVQQIRVHKDQVRFACSLFLLAGLARVLAANQPPTVRVIAPTPADDLRAPANFTCTAEASDADGRVTKVEFYAWSHALKLGTATNAPYSVTAKPVFTVPRMSIIARACDDQGAATDSDPVWITVTDDVSYPPRAKPREERLISAHVPGSGHEGIPSLLEMPDGDLLCAFYSGHYELSVDSSVYLTRLPRGASAWERPRIIIGGDNIPKANPVLMLGRDGVLWCFYANIENGQELECSRPCYRQSRDGGVTWAPLEPTALDNPSTRSDFVALPSGKLVLACNVSPVHRAPVNVLLSDDLGRTWRVNRAIETGPGAYGYCAVIRTRDGRILIAYDTDRRVIKHAVVAESWFDEPAVMVDYRRP
jgi:hypothetical protein